MVILLLCKSKKRLRQQEPKVLGHTKLQTGIPILSSPAPQPYILQLIDPTPPEIPSLSAARSSPPQKPSYATVLKSSKKLCENGK